MLKKLLDEVKPVGDKKNEEGQLFVGDCEYIDEDIKKLSSSFNL